MQLAVTKSFKFLKNFRWLIGDEAVVIHSNKTGNVGIT